MTVSLSEGANIDLQAIVTGGNEFAKRLETFSQQAAEAKQLREQAYSLQALAVEKMKEAEAKLAEVESASEAQRLAQAQAEAAKAKYEALYQKIMAIAGSTE